MSPCLIKRFCISYKLIFSSFEIFFSKLVLFFLSTLLFSSFSFIRVDNVDIEDLLRKNCLPFIDAFRERHGAASLEWSAELYRKALDITTRLAEKDLGPKYLTKYERSGLTLDYIPLTETGNNDTQITPCLRAANSWYGQKANYNYEKPTMTDENRDFTQLIWKATRNAGIATKITNDGKSAYVAAVFDPAAIPAPVVAFRKDLMFNGLDKDDSSNDLSNNVLSYGGLPGVVQNKLHGEREYIVSASKDEQGYRRDFRLHDTRKKYKSFKKHEQIDVSKTDSLISHESKVKTKKKYNDDDIVIDNNKDELKEMKKNNTIDGDMVKLKDEKDVVKVETGSSEIIPLNDDNGFFVIKKNKMVSTRPKLIIVEPHVAAKDVTDSSSTAVVSTNTQVKEDENPVEVSFSNVSPGS